MVVSEERECTMIEIQTIEPIRNSGAIVRLKKGEGRSLKAGGAWIYDNEVDSVRGTFTNGDILCVEDFDGFPLGYGFINENSKIRVRMLSRWQQQPIDPAFIRRRVEAAWEYRKQVMGGMDDKGHLRQETIEKGDLNACRIIFGEADWLPGLVVDKYADVLVVESLALGMEALKPLVLQVLIELLEEDGIRIRAVFERSDALVRKKEGLVPFKGLLYGTEEDSRDPHVEIWENGVSYLVDVLNGQKTGFFLDQKYNRLAIQRLCPGKRVLDCFTHMGTFALNAGIAGAAQVTGLDISDFAIQQARENTDRNHLQQRVHFRTANVLDELPRLAAAGEQYDVVVLDPPAFTKSREATKNAIKGYREINRKGLTLVKDGGYLATCSCSHFMTQELFTKTIREAATSVHKRLRQVEFRTQAPDHPILWAADESYYLKFYIFQVCEEK
jgi:23S rRNA (cytosine1962-C5)-methyltransferase